MILTTTETIPNAEVVALMGIARGSTVRSKNAFGDLFAGIKSIFGGELGGYTKLQADAREQALSRLKKDAEKMGANAVIGVRLTTSTITQGASEILAYGTAVKIK